ncbi:MAG: hypothetical protein H0W12_06880 [Chitinophagaceae bacterium]|nr:hypothetical protein [Chitinophagaceae bacterium]
MQILMYGIYLFLAVFAAGNMVTLQIQHYGIYPFVGKEKFAAYMQANNKSAAIPSIMPAMLLLIVNIILIFTRPVFMPATAVYISLALNLIAFISTFAWQRKLQGEMAVSGYDELKIKRLNATNWIRTFAFLTQAVIAVAVVMNAIK